MTICKNCGKAIKWFRDTEKDKWIPLESNCDLEYEKPEDVDMDEVARWRHKCNKTGVLKCNKGLAQRFILTLIISLHQES